jgi:hypothetical protein
VLVVGNDRGDVVDASEQAGGELAGVRVGVG